MHTFSSYLDCSFWTLCFSFLFVYVFHPVSPLWVNHYITLPYVGQMTVNLCATVFLFIECILNTYTYIFLANVLKARLKWHIFPTSNALVVLVAIEMLSEWGDKYYIRKMAQSPKAWQIKYNASDESIAFNLLNFGLMFLDAMRCDEIKKKRKDNQERKIITNAIHSVISLNFFFVLFKFISIFFHFN